MDLKERIIEINKKLGGKLVREGSLDFAVSRIKNERNIYKKNAYLIRAMIIDHPFDDFNKSTASAIMLEEFNKEGIRCDENSFIRGIISMAKENLTDINRIEDRLRKWCKKA